MLPQGHQQLDEFTTNWLEAYSASGRDIHCRKGCSGCCHLAVHATFPEAVAVATLLSEQQKKCLAGHIDRLRDAIAELTDLKSYLKTHREKLGPCPFLDAQGGCSIYSIRPLSCRALLSTRPSAWCTVDFATLDAWDKQAYESGLDREIVTWPTHFVAATQDYGQELEMQLLASMHQQYGWSLSGNFALMVWLAEQHQSENSFFSKQAIRSTLSDNRLNSELLLIFSD